VGLPEIDDDLKGKFDAHKRYRIRRKRAGGCSRCGADATPGRSACEWHLRLMREYRKRKRAG